jgi:hypothetical protein
MNALDAFRLFQQVEGALRADARVHLADAVRGFLEDFSLELAPGQKSPAETAKRGTRDDALRTCAKFFPGMSIREQAEQLERVHNRYFSSRWKRDAGYAECPYTADKLEHSLWQALKASPRVLSAARIRRILGA